MRKLIKLLKAVSPVIIDVATAVLTRLLLLKKP